MLCNKGRHKFLNLQFFLAQSVPDERNVLCYFIIYTIISILAAVWVIVRCQEPRVAWGWALAMVLCMPLALLLYSLCEVEREVSGEVLVRSSYSRLQNLIANGCGSAVTLHNRVQALHSGDETFAALLRDVQRARYEINVEYYILVCDRIGKALLSVLMRRSRAGVKVRIIYDAVGSWRITRKERERIAQSGIEIRPFAPVRFPWLTREAHRRNHRKVVVIDGRIAYIGGVNIARRYMGGRTGVWRDEHLRVEGAAAYQALLLFARDWRTAGGDIKVGTSVVPQVQSICPMQIAWSQRGRSRKTLQHMFVETISSARHAVRISTPYFLPSEPLLEAIIVAARSGVKVELVIPRSCDVRVVELAAQSYIERCVSAGVEVYRYGGGFLHAKSISVDDGVAIVGSANLDSRSLDYNMEVAAVIYNRAVVAGYISRFIADVALSDRVSQEAFAHIGFGRRLKQALARLLAPIL